MTAPARLTECSVDGCDQPVRCVGLCGGHYRRKLAGSPLAGPIKSKPRRPLHLRFWAKVRIERWDDCWIWTDGLDRYGYAWIGRGGRGAGRIAAHRCAWELLVGPIPEGLHVDHLCRTPACVNPLHLEPVTQGENTRRGESLAGRNSRKTHCLHGHEFTESNTYYPPTGGRICRECKRARQRGYYQRRAA